MNTKQMLLRTVAATALFVAGATVTLADDAPDAGDPPSIVGRLSLVEGTVSFHAADQSEWAPATLNYPVTTGTSFWTEPGARSEIEIGDAEVRMDQSTSLDIVELDDAQTQLQVNQGAAISMCGRCRLPEWW